jgi:hypothetical protein
MRVIDLFEKKYQGFFAAVNAAKRGRHKPEGLSSKTWGEARKVAGKGKKKVHESFIGFLLNEDGDVPETEYGYWIANNGKIIPVNDEQGHVRVLKLLGRTPYYGDAFYDGWIRVVVVPTRPDKKAPNGVQFGAIDFEMGETPSAKALYAAIKVLAHHADDGMMYNVDIASKAAAVPDSDTFTKPQAVAGMFKSLASKVSSI